MINAPNLDSSSKIKDDISSANQPDEQSFFDFITSEFIPALRLKFKDKGIEDIKLSFEEKKIPIIRQSCWTLYGEFPDLRRFWVCFTGKDVAGLKAILLASPGCEPTVIEPFFNTQSTPEYTPGTLTSRIIQRLEAQQWLNPS